MSLPVVVSVEAEYAAGLEGNLERLLHAFKSGSYRAPAVRRVYIPKADGRKTRPIGIPTFEDKVLQRAVVMALEAVYEQDFFDCSYGFRPGRSAHAALEMLWKGLTNMGGGWVLELDIESFFDTVDHGHLRSMLDQRVRDGVLSVTLFHLLSTTLCRDASAVVSLFVSPAQPRGIGDGKRSAGALCEARTPALA